MPSTTRRPTRVGRPRSCAVGTRALGTADRVAVFAAGTTIRSLLDPDGTMHWSEFDRGGHFPAMETPNLLVDDLRAFFHPLRRDQG